MSSPSPARRAQRRSPHRGAARWIAALLVMVASPCATDLMLGGVATALSTQASDSAAAADLTRPARATCCPEHETTPQPGDAPAPAPDDDRAACACCHCFPPATLLPLPESTAHVTPPRAPDALVGQPVDGHAQPPFRPPTCA